jgi:hypothetical protein
VSFQVLEGHNYVSLVTYRRNGAKVPTPVWFVLDDGHIYVWTVKTSGKVKRIRNNPKVAFAPCKMRGDPVGPYFEGTATISENDSSKALRKLFKSKYGLLLVLDRLSNGLERKESVYLEITPS